MKHILVVFAALMLLASCSKKVSELPEPTQSGSNTFGAKVDGKLWAPKGFGIMPTAPTLEANFAGGDSYKINARNFASSPTETEFELLLTNVKGPGTYYFAENGSYAKYYLRKFQLISEWATTASNTGKYVITKLDIPNKIIAGTFEFNATDIYGGAAPITVTEGRFDVKIQ